MAQLETENLQDFGGDESQHKQMDVEAPSLPPTEFSKEVHDCLRQLYKQAEESPAFPEGASNFPTTLAALGTPPACTTVRFDTCKLSAQEAIESLRVLLDEECRKRGFEPPPIELHGLMSDVLSIPSAPLPTVRPALAEVTVGLDCAMAVLRGADVFAPGVLGMMHGARAGEQVSVWGDLDKTCARGLATRFPGRKVFVGNGIVEIGRTNFFILDGPTSGVVVRITQPLYACVSLPSLSLERQTGLCLQNLPSCVAAHVLDAQPGHAVLDCCAAPGGKTTQIASLMQGTGLLVALERGAAKVFFLCTML